MPWSAQIHTAFHVCRITQELPRVSQNFDYGDFTLCVGTFQVLHLFLEQSHVGVLQPRRQVSGLGSSAFARHY